MSLVPSSSDTISATMWVALESIPVYKGWPCRFSILQLVSFLRPRSKLKQIKPTPNLSQVFPTHIYIPRLSSSVSISRPTLEIANPFSIRSRFPYRPCPRPFHTPFRPPGRSIPPAIMVATSSLKHVVLAALVALPTVFAAPVALTRRSADASLRRRTDGVKNQPEIPSPYHEQLEVRGNQFSSWEVLGSETTDQQREQLEIEMENMTPRQKKKYMEARKDARIASLEAEKMRKLAEVSLSMQGQLDLRMKARLDKKKVEIESSYLKGRKVAEDEFAAWCKAAEAQTQNRHTIINFS